jgi:cytochrome P450
VAALRSQVEWIAFTSPVEPWTHWNPARPFILWNNQRIMRKEIGAELDKRFAEMQSQTADEKRSKPKTRSIVSLALANYVAGVEQDDELPPFVNFKTQLTAQIVLFLLAGHETTSSTICLCYHSLFTHSDALARIRKEHEEVFGQERSTSHISSMITTQPELLNQLPYTLAVIRETLRLYPPASQIRIGDANINLTDDAGNVFPTAGAKVWVNHTAVHRNPKYWPEPDTFIPERWLAKEGDPLYPVKGAWRPFEFGPRNCIGQTLALMEIKIVLLMTIREFDILPMYDDAAPRVWGSQAHMIQSKGVGGKPSNGYPVIVKTRL